jgi:protein-S-isoprenylcysteine O-methyltransferase Ste14
VNGSSLLLRLPPPLQYAAFFGAGLLLDRLIPWSPEWMHGNPARWAGGILLVSAGLLALTSLGLLVINRTTVIPHAQPSRLITSGPFALSRNPIYVALTALYCGAALLAARAWPLLLLPAPVAILDRVFIPFEEDQLRQIFGERYADYCRRVRRWL